MRNVYERTRDLLSGFYKKYPVIVELSLLMLSSYIAAATMGFLIGLGLRCTVRSSFIIAFVFGFIGPMGFSASIVLESISMAMTVVKKKVRKIIRKKRRMNNDYRIRKQLLH